MIRERIPRADFRGATTVRQIVARIQDEEVTFLAAAIAYYAFVSVIPALLITVAVATTVGGESLANRVVVGGQEFLTPAGQGLLADAISGARGRTGATVVGLLVLIWSSLRVFRGLDIAFSRVYGTAGSLNILDQLRDGLVVLLSIGLAIVAMFAIGTLLAALALPVRSGVLGLALLLPGLVLVFLPLYVVFPDVPMTVHEAFPGAVFAAVGWVILQAAFQVYAAMAAQYDLYGVIGGALLLVTWFYIAAIALLAGAVVNAVLGPENRQYQGPSHRDI